MVDNIEHTTSSGLFKQGAIIAANEGIYCGQTMESAEKLLLLLPVVKAQKLEQTHKTCYYPVAVKYSYSARLGLETPGPHPTTTLELRGRTWIAGEDGGGESGVAG